jgi:hypothetical protein
MPNTEFAMYYLFQNDFVGRQIINGKFLETITNTMGKFQIVLIIWKLTKIILEQVLRRKSLKGLKSEVGSREMLPPKSRDLALVREEQLTQLYCSRTEETSNEARRIGRFQIMFSPGCHARETGLHHECRGIPL